MPCVLFRPFENWFGKCPLWVSSSRSTAASVAKGWPLPIHINYLVVSISGSTQLRSKNDSSGPYRRSHAQVPRHLEPGRSKPGSKVASSLFNLLSELIILRREHFEWVSDYRQKSWWRRRDYRIICRSRLSRSLWLCRRIQ